MVSGNRPNEDLEAAILSIYQHALDTGPPPEGLSEEYMPLPLAKATEVVSSLGTFSDQKSSVALLIAGGRLETDREAVLTLIESLVPGNAAARDELLSLKADPSFDGRVSTQEKVFEIIERHNISGGACAAADPVWWAVRNLNNDITTAHVVIQIDENPPKPNRVVQLLHPFRWNNNYPDYFLHSYPTEGSYDYASGIAVPYTGPRPSLHNKWGYSATNPGQSIYEELQFPTKLSQPYHQLCLYRNLLFVEWSGVQPNGFDVRMDYKLNDSTYCKLLFGTLRDGPNGLLTDDGYMLAQKNPNGWRWTGVKRIRFADLTPGDPLIPGVPDFGKLMNWIAPATLGRFLQTGMETKSC